MYEMARKISSYCAYLLDLLSPYGSITSRAMFGGYGLYKNGIIFGIVVDDEVYFKVDGTNQAQYEELDSEPFSYEKNGKSVKLSYWKVPLEVLENEELLERWLEHSYNISRKMIPTPVVK